MLLDKRRSQQSLVDDYRSAFAEAQSWFERISKAFESLEPGSGVTIERRLARANGELATECIEGGATRVRYDVQNSVFNSYTVPYTAFVDCTSSFSRFCKLIRVLANTCFPYKIMQASTDLLLLQVYQREG